MAGLLADVLPYLYSQGDRAKRRLNGLLSDPLGELEQTAYGLMDAHREQQGLLARAFANPERPFQVTDKLALGQAIDNTMAGPLGFAPVGMAKLVKPLGTQPHYRVNDLSEYTPTLYRETSINQAADFLPNSAGAPKDLWFANEPSFALGQGGNRGVMLEFDAKNIPGQLSLSKPMARNSYDGGMAEFISRDADPAAIGGNLTSIRITKDQQRGPYFQRVKSLLKNWPVQKDADGALTFAKPPSNY